MGDLSAIISLLNLVGLGGVAFFLYYIYRGLQERIKTLTELTQEQNRTLEAVRGRAQEMDRLSESYKRALLDFEEMGKKLEERRMELVKELEAANLRKDEQLAEFTHLQLEEIELKKQSLQRLPEIESKLGEVVSELESQLRILAPAQKQVDLFDALSPIHVFQSKHHLESPWRVLLQRQASDQLLRLIWEIAQREHPKITFETKPEGPNDDGKE